MECGVVSTQSLRCEEEGEMFITLELYWLNYFFDQTIWSETNNWTDGNYSEGLKAHKQSIRQATF